MGPVLSILPAVFPLVTGLVNAFTKPRDSRRIGPNVIHETGKSQEQLLKEAEDRYRKDYEERFEQYQQAMEAKYKQMMEEFTKSKGALPEPVRLTAQQLRARFPGLDTKNNFNFAVVGESGVGKSSLINALRGLKALDAGAAPVGHVECTKVPVPYPVTDPAYSHVVFWDMPGGNTLNFPGDTYFMDQALYAFDGLVLVCSNRFKEIDVQIAAQTQEPANKHQRIAFVRTRADTDIDSMVHDGVAATRADAIRLLRNDSQAMLLQVLQDAKVQIASANVMIVSARNLAEVVKGGKAKSDLIDEENLYTFLYQSGRDRIQK